jgi:hypothetical protein
MVKWESFDVDLQKLQIKPQVRTCVDGVHKTFKQEGMDKECKIHTWAMNSWFGMPYSWETKDSIIWS